MTDNDRAALFSNPVREAYEKRLRGLWPLRHNHPRFREWIRQTVEAIRNER